MKCDNCGKNDANVKYLRNINGVKKEMNLCEECSQKLGINDINFDLPIDFSSFLEGFFEDFENSDIISLMESKNSVQCKGCNSTFEDIINTGKFGCPECYETFETEIDNLMNKLHGSNRHKGRLGKLGKAKVEKEEKTSDISNQESKKVEENERLEDLKKQLKELIKEEKYEEAAKIRDEIKRIGG